MIEFHFLVLPKPVFARQRVCRIEQHPLSNQTCGSVAINRSLIFTKKHTNAKLAKIASESFVTFFQISDTQKGFLRRSQRPPAKKKKKNNFFQEKNPQHSPESAFACKRVQIEQWGRAALHMPTSSISTRQSPPRFLSSSLCGGAGARPARLSLARQEAVIAGERSASATEHC